MLRRENRIACRGMDTVLVRLRELCEQPVVSGNRRHAGEMTFFHHRSSDYSGY